MIVQKGTPNNPFGHGDLHALPCLGLQQADTRQISTNFCVVQKMYVSLKTMALPIFLDGTLFTLNFLSCEKGLLTSSLKHPNA